MRAKRAAEKKQTKTLSKIIITLLFLGCIAIIINLAPNYIRDKLKGKTKVIINNSNITTSLKKEIKIDEKDIIYMSFEDIDNFFDGEIFFDEMYNQIITTSDTKVATIPLNSKQMNINGSKITIYGEASKQENTYYLPISEMKKIYNLDVNYNKESNIVTIDSLDKEQKNGNASKNSGVKYKPTMFSKNVDKVKKGESVIVIDDEDGWTKVRTKNGNIGYIKKVANIYNTRENIEREKQIDGKVSMVWDYYGEYSKAPTRTEKIEGLNVVAPAMGFLIENGKGDLHVNIGNEGKAYIKWAHNNGYKVWALVSNNSLPDTTAEILKDYKLREKLINNIITMVLENDLDGIDIDFENMKLESKDLYTRLIIELAPRLREYGKILSVDVTAPDGSENWSLCYDRHKIAKAADYIVFMGYDQYGDSSKTAGTTAGCDWVEVNIKKFLGQEEVSKDKIILGMPFFARLWKEAGATTNNAIPIKNFDKYVPSDAKREWNDSLKQNYVTFSQNGANYKIWLEDEESLKYKLDLIKEYDLAGGAYWQKDFETPNIWNLINEKLKK